VETRSGRWWSWQMADCWRKMTQVETVLVVLVNEGALVVLGLL
jgi:hypothetical protein